MPIVIRRENSNGWNDAGNAISNGLNTYFQLANQQAQNQNAHARSMASLGMMGAQMRRQEREDQKMAQKDAARARIKEALSGMDMNSPDFGKQIMPFMVDAPDIAGPMVNSWNSQRNTDRMIAAQESAAARQNAMLTRESPEMMAKRAYAAASLVSEEQRTPEQKQAIALGQILGIKPEGATGKPMGAADAAKTAGMTNAYNEIQNIVGGLFDDRGAFKRGSSLQSWIPGTDESEYQKKAMQATEAWLRAMTGAAAPASEVKNYMSMYFPMPWDSDKVAMDKLERLENQFSGTLNLMGRGKDLAPSTLSAVKMRRQRGTHPTTAPEPSVDDGWEDVQ